MNFGQKNQERGDKKLMMYFSCSVGLLIRIYLVLQLNERSEKERKKVPQIPKKTMKNGSCSKQMAFYATYWIVVTLLIHTLISRWVDSCPLTAHKSSNLFNLQLDCLPAGLPSFLSPSLSPFLASGSGTIN